MSEQCQYPGCESTDVIRCTTDSMPDVDVPSGYYCENHAEQLGYCTTCGFYDYPKAPSGGCSWCNKMLMTSVLLRMTVDERDDLRRAAKERGLDVNEAIRVALRQVYGVRHETRPRGKYTRKPHQ